MVWFLGSLGALLGGLDFRGPAILALLALYLPDFMFLKDVWSGITGFGPPRGLGIELRNCMYERN